MTGPLDGVRVIDLTAMVSGPLATAILADQGADVVKIEPPGTGDLIRHIGTSRGGLSAIFTTCNRGKRSLVIDLARDAVGARPGVAVLHRLVAAADVFVQNFRPGVAAAMGLGASELCAIQPGLVYVSISGFGETGPYAGRRVYDIVIQALSGMAASQADPESGEPALVRNIVCDKVAALHAAQAISAALFARERGRGGQHVRLNMLDASIAFLWPDVMQSHTYLGEGASPPAHLAGFLSVRRTADGHMTIFAIADVEFEGMCRALDRPELIGDPRFVDTESRMRNADALAAILDRAAEARTTAELSARLEAEDVPHAPVNRLDELHRDPQVVSNGLLVEMDHPSAGRVRTPRPVSTFEGTPGGIRRAAPRLGEHGREVLAEFGLGADEIAALCADGVVG